MSHRITPPKTTNRWLVTEQGMFGWSCPECGMESTPAFMDIIKAGVAYSGHMLYHCTGTKR